jgi:hypothetical protein
MSKPFLPLFFCLLVACNSSANKSEENPKVYGSHHTEEHGTMGEVYARKQLNKALNGQGQPFTWDTLIKSSSTAIAMAEPILFDIFGKEMILSEKPYEVYLIDGYWCIAGTIPKGWNGGGFEIIFSAKDGRIIRFTHYK